MRHEWERSGRSKHLINTTAAPFPSPRSPPPLSGIPAHLRTVGFQLWSEVRRVPLSQSSLDSWCQLPGSFLPQVSRLSLCMTALLGLITVSPLLYQGYLSPPCHTLSWITEIRGRKSC